MHNYVACLVIAFLGIFVSQAQQGIGDWSKEKLYDVDTLYHKITNNDMGNIVILNTGPVGNIKYAKRIGPVEQEKYLKKLKKLLPKIDASQEIVIYCGCCPLVVCPNLEPAYLLLKKNNFSVRVLALKESLEENWIRKKYPME
jgi:hypothetical protein